MVVELVMEDMSSLAFWATVALWFAMILATIAVYIVLREGSGRRVIEIESLKKSYEDRIKGYEKEIESLKSSLEAKEKEKKEEIERFAKISRMLQELYAAMQKDAVKLACPQHIGANATLLVDGTIRCDKGHILWAPGAVTAETAKPPQSASTSMSASMAVSVETQTQQASETVAASMTWDQFEKLARNYGIRVNARKLRGFYIALFEELSKESGSKGGGEA